MKTEAKPHADQARILGETLKLTRELARAGRRPAWILDIDDTLLSTSGRHLRILREFASHKGISHKVPAQVRYLITETARAAGLSDERLLSELREFWFARFFRNEYLLEDEPIDGAQDYCRELLEAGARIVYLTGRDETMREGTLAALRKHDFPLAEPSSLLLKPEFSTPDREFKEQALARIAAEGPVAGGFENEPLHIHLLLEIFPKGRMVLVDSRHSGRPAPPLSGVPKIKDYRRGSP